jgi:hypothetical protein
MWLVSQSSRRWGVVVICCQFAHFPDATSLIGALSHEEKTRIVDSVVDWVRNNDPKALTLNNLTVDYPKGGELARFPTADINGRPISSEEKQDIVQNAIDWVRHNDSSPDSLDEPSLQSLSKMTGQEVSLGCLRPAEKKAVHDTLVDWICNNDVPLKDLDEPTMEALSNLAGIPLSQRLQKPNSAIAQDALQCLRNNNKTLSNVSVTTIRKWTVLTTISWMPCRLCQEFR